ncbi:hypothetical protein AS156_00965 [Bradyrhizobium macuxiense]|uniref:Prohead serine protease domain-containing protein n=1 Tax=Bradyrhizobium macuxiense TaxID=1755647 RepID=A0A109JSW6_9BRAD|nr:HK97 family phage prohead protease [Bradyrhizobium macuxiense]KWV54330.1 hypothetical protein AS156_00965 [Bradyrhizobium macuxiense]
MASVGSYDPESHTAEAVLSIGAAVRRLYGTEKLEITPKAVDLGRAQSGLVPLIDSHNIAGIGSVLGRVSQVRIEAGKLIGLLSFDDSDAGRNAEGLVARGTLKGISIGYRVDEWQVTDDDGNVVDPDRERLMWDEQYVFTAVRWELLEVSLVSVPADPDAMIRSTRSMSSSAPIGAERAAEILGRMRTRHQAALNLPETGTLSSFRRRHFYFPHRKTWGT